MMVMIEDEALDDAIAKEEHPSLFNANVYFNVLAKGRFTVTMHEAHGLSGPPCYYFFVFGDDKQNCIGVGVKDDLFLKLAFSPVEKLAKHLTSDNEAVQELLKLRLE